MSSDDPVRARYERFAQRYDQIFAERQAPKIHSLRAVMPSPLPQPVLDLGAGTGLLARELEVEVIALDFARAMLQQAEGRRVQADLRALPFADETMGTIFSVSALIELDDLEQAMGEMIRVLRPEGWLALSVLKTEDLTRVHRVLDAASAVPYTRLDLGEDVGFVVQKVKRR